MKKVNSAKQHNKRPMLIIKLGLLTLALIGIGILGHQLISNNQQNQPKFLVIKELGIKVPLTPDIEDATYYFNPINPNFPAVDISTKSLSQNYPACAAGPGIGPLGTIQQSTVSPKESPEISAGPEDTLKVGNKFIYWMHAQAACTDNQSGINLLNKLSYSFQLSFRKSQPI